MASDSSASTNDTPNSNRPPDPVNGPLPDAITEINDYERHEWSSEINQYRFTKDNESFGLKVIPFDPDKPQPVLNYEEIKMLKSIKFRFAMVNLDFFPILNVGHGLLTEFLPTSLAMKIKETRDRNGIFQKSRILKWSSQLAMAVAHIHSLNIMHRDITPYGVFLSDHSRSVKIGDFGVMRFLPPDGSISSTVIELHKLYYAPELLKHGARYHMNVDVWSLGCTIYEMLTLQQLAPSKDDPIPIDKAVDSLSEQPHGYDPEFVNGFIDLLHRMCHKVPAERIISREVLIHPLLKKTVEKLNQENADGVRET